MSLFVLFGPGNHEHLLEAALARNKISYGFSKYWPKFQLGQFENKARSIKKEGGSYDKLSYLLWAIWHRLPVLNRTQGHLDVLFRYYDFLTATALPKETKILLAWSQVGLYTMQKAKKQGAVVILEHPMVHVNTWMSLMKEEFKNNAHGEGVKYSLFTRSMVQRMLVEYQTADYINVISSYSKQTFLDHGVPESKLILSPLGIDTDFFTLPSEKNNNGKFKILFVGRLELLKGVHYLLQAIAELNLMDVELILAGRRLPEMEPYLKKYESFYKYVGTKSQLELKELYQNVDLLVLPSVQESFGLVLAEAMACGVPVIATCNTGGPDIIEEGINGFVVPIRDVEAMKGRIAEMFADRARCREMGLAARRKVAEDFNLVKYSERIGSMLKYVSK